MSGALFLLLDPLCLVVAAWFALRLGPAGPGAAGLFGAFDGDLLPAALVAAVLAAFTLYDPRFGLQASRGGGVAGLLRTHVLRFALFLVGLLALGAASGAMRSFPNTWLMSWLVGTLALTLLARVLAARSLQRLQRAGAAHRSHRRGRRRPGRAASRACAAPDTRAHRRAARRVRRRLRGRGALGRHGAGHRRPAHRAGQDAQDRLDRAGPARAGRAPPAADAEAAEGAVGARSACARATSRWRWCGRPSPSSAITCRWACWCSRRRGAGIRWCRPANRSCRAGSSPSCCWRSRAWANSAGTRGFLRVSRAAACGQAQPAIRRRRSRRLHPIAAGFGQSDYGYVVTPNVDHLIRLHDDAAFRALYDAGRLRAARQPLRRQRAAARRRASSCRCARGSDLTAALLREVIAPDDAIVLIGGTPAQALQLVNAVRPAPAVAARAADGLRARSRRPCRPACSFIEAHSPFRFCLLAVGSPQQEVLAQALRERGTARGLALCIGASINFITGDEQRAPRWMQRSGMEWLYRLMQDPRRMARRYLVRGPRVFGVLRKAEHRAAAAAPRPRLSADDQRRQQPALIVEAIVAFDPSGAEQHQHLVVVVAAWRSAASGARARAAAPSSARVAGRLQEGQQRARVADRRVVAALAPRRWPGRPSRAACRAGGSAPHRARAASASVSLPGPDMPAHR